MKEHAQMIHGDMNYGNFLMDTSDGRPVFIDFEDSAKNWLSPLYDLAFVIQRFILTHEEKKRRKLLYAFVEGYKQSHKILPSQRMDALHVMCRMISVYALLLLSLLQDHEQANFSDEYEKFIWLYKHTDKKQVFN